MIGFYIVTKGLSHPIDHSEVPQTPSHTLSLLRSPLPSYLGAKNRMRALQPSAKPASARSQDTHTLRRPCSNANPQVMPDDIDGRKLSPSCRLRVRCSEEQSQSVSKSHLLLTRRWPRSEVRAASPSLSSLPNDTSSSRCGMLTSYYHWP